MKYSLPWYNQCEYMNFVCACCNVAYICVCDCDIQFISNPPIYVFLNPFAFGHLIKSGC